MEILDMYFVTGHYEKVAKTLKMWTKKVWESLR